MSSKGRLIALIDKIPEESDRTEARELLEWIIQEETEEAYEEGFDEGYQQGIDEYEC